MDDFQQLLKKVEKLQREHDKLMAALPKLRFDSKELSRDITAKRHKLAKLWSSIDKVKEDIAQRKQAAAEAVANQYNLLAIEARRLDKTTKETGARLNEWSSVLDKNSLELLSRAKLLEEEFSRLVKLSTELDSRSVELDARDKKLVDWQARLDKREDSLKKRTKELDYREECVAEEEELVARNLAEAEDTRHVAEKVREEAMAYLESNALEALNNKQNKEELEGRNRFLDSREKEITKKEKLLNDRMRMVRISEASANSVRSSEQQDVLARREADIKRREVEIKQKERDLEDRIHRANLGFSL